MIAPTLSPEDAIDRLWDAIVIGAGPAGGFLTLRLAQSGQRVLLIERQHFPREKVCGGCVSGRALAMLKAAGLPRRLIEAQATTTSRLHLISGRTEASLAIPLGVALPRSVLDHLIVQQAIQSGANFLPGTLAKVDPACEPSSRTVSCILTNGESANIRGRFLIAADGLAHNSLPSDASLQSQVDPRSRIGVGAVIQNCSDAPIEGSTIHMSIAKEGYVGMVRLPKRQLSIAAAIDPQVLRQTRSPLAAVAAVLSSAGRPQWARFATDHWSNATWHGTPLLTRKVLRPSGERLFVLGDAAGYVEPFTGEGITWAIAGAELLVGLLGQHNFAWSPSIAHQWNSTYRTCIARRQRFCRLLAKLLRSPWSVHTTIRLLQVAPSCAIPLVHHWQQPLTLVPTS